MTFPRAAGILLHPTSLPGPNGIGDLGPEAHRFLDVLTQTGMKIWQVLPLGPTGYGDSPYQCFSAFAGNPLLIYVAGNGGTGDGDFPAHTVAFDRGIPHRKARLRAALDRFTPDATYRAFVVQEHDWLEDYALFMALKEAHGKQSQGQRVDHDRQTLSQFLTNWLRDEVKPNRSPKTYDSYEETVRLHIIPDLGKKQLIKLSAPDVQRLLRRKEESGLSPRSVAYIRTVLRIALARAVKWDLAPRNVAALVDAPRVRQKERVTCSHEEAMVFRDHVESDRLGALFSVALAIGLRKGEALGLRWNDIDFEREELRVRNQLQRVKGQGLILREPKTERSRRRIKLPPQIVEALRAHKARQDRERLFAGDRWQETGHVFTTSIGTPIEPTNINKHFSRLVRESGLPHQTFHDQRHWCATMLLARGVPVQQVMDLLGHTLVATTVDMYRSQIEERRQQTADVVGSLLSAKSEKKAIT